MNFLTWFVLIVAVSSSKIGIVDIGMIEQTPFVFHSTLYRLETVRKDYWNNTEHSSSYLRIIDVVSGYQVGPNFGLHLDLFGGCAWSDGTNNVFAYGTERRPGMKGTRIHVFYSTDLRYWKTTIALELPSDFDAFNTSVDKDEDGWIMAIELGSPKSIIGARFTEVFGKSSNGLTFTLLDPSKYIYSKAHYTACPAIRYISSESLYYMLFTIWNGTVQQWQVNIVKTHNLRDFTLSPKTVLKPSAADYTICPHSTCADEHLNSTQKKYTNTVQDLNNSDPDLTEFEGSVHFYFMWGDQRSTETSLLTLAVYTNVTLPAFLGSWF